MYRIILISHASKGMLKILQSRLQQYKTENFQMYKLGFKEAKEPEVKFCWTLEKERGFQKNIYVCFIDYAKAFDHVDHKTVENSSRDKSIKLPYLSPEKTVCRSRSHSQQPDMEQWMDLKLGKEYINAIYCYPVYLTYM